MLREQDRGPFQANASVDRCGEKSARRAMAGAGGEDERALVEEAWRAADPLRPDTIPTGMLRAFGWYILERHY